MQAHDSDQRGQPASMPACLDRSIAEVEMSLLAPLPLGAAVIATDNFGPIIRGQLGIVTGRRSGSWLPWRRTSYHCTFLGGIRVTAARWQLMPHDHGCGLQILENPRWFLHTRDVLLKGRNFAAELRRPAR